MEHRLPFVTGEQPTARLKAQIPSRLVGRYGHLIMRYGSAAKLWNATAALWHWAREHETISTKPVFLKAEISRQCLVRCLRCPSTTEEVFMPFDEFKQLVDSVKSSVVMVQLHEIGEPLLHPQALSCIGYAHHSGLATVISTSLSMEKPDSFWEALVNSGLDYLIVAIDGVTSDVYNRYRTEGRLDLVLANLRRIIAHRAQHHAPMTIEWQMVEFPWNRDQRAAAHSLALELGCDLFRSIPDSHVRYRYADDGEIRERNCVWPFLLLLVSATGDVLPCFKPGCHPPVVGNLKEESIDEVWNGKAMRQLRTRHLIESCSGCRTCKE